MSSAVIMCECFEESDVGRLHNGHNIHGFKYSLERLIVVASNLTLSITPCSIVGSKGYRTTKN